MIPYFIDGLTATASTVQGGRTHLDRGYYLKDAYKAA